jgi:hypothetical protein
VLELPLGGGGDVKQEIYVGIDVSNGRVTIIALLSAVPELGTLNRKQVAKLVGLHRSATTAA